MFCYVSQTFLRPLHHLNNYILLVGQNHTYSYKALFYYSNHGNHKPIGYRIDFKGIVLTQRHKIIRSTIIDTTFFTTYKPTYNISLHLTIKGAHTVFLLSFVLEESMADHLG